MRDAYTDCTTEPRGPHNFCKHAAKTIQPFRLVCHVLNRPIYTACSGSLPSFSSIHVTISSIVHTLIPHFLPNFKQSSVRIMPPPTSSGRPSTLSPSLIISQITPTGCLPASLQRSTAASVCPLRTLTPPSRACSGRMCPGRLKWLALALGSASMRHVRLLSWALMPVETLSSLASMEMA